MPKENLESFCLWASAISKSCSRRCVSHFAIIISGVKLSNGWNREVLHIVKISCCFASLIVPLNIRGGLKRLCRRRAFLSYHKAPSILPRYPKISQRYHKDINKILQSTQQRHCVDLVYFWYHSPWILNIKVRSCVLYPCIIRRYPYSCDSSHKVRVRHWINYRGWHWSRSGRELQVQYL